MVDHSDSNPVDPVVTGARPVGGRMINRGWINWINYVAARCCGQLTCRAFDARPERERERQTQREREREREKRERRERGSL